MIKGIAQVGLIVTAVVCTAFVEAVMPVWLADSMSSATHIMSQGDEGTMAAWRKCMTKDRTGVASTRSQHHDCSLAVALAKNGTLELSEVALDDGSHCPHEAASTQRNFSGRITNTSISTYISDALWFASYPVDPRPKTSAGRPEDLWIAPGDSLKTCLFTLTFDTPTDAAQYDAKPHKLTFRVGYERGMIGD